MQHSWILLLSYFLVAGLGPSLWVGYRLESVAKKVKSIEEVGGSYWQSVLRWILPLLVAPIGWAMLSAYVLFNPEPGEVTRLLSGVYVLSSVAIAAGLVLQFAYQWVLRWFEVADEVLFK